MTGLVVVAELEGRLAAALALYRRGCHKDSLQAEEEELRRRDCWVGSSAAEIERLLVPAHIP